jgi:tight adherence protein B
MSATVLAAATGVLTVALALGAHSARGARRRVRLVHRLVGGGSHSAAGSGVVARLAAPWPWFARAVPTRLPTVRIERAWRVWLGCLAGVAVVLGTVAGAVAGMVGVALAVGGSVLVLRAPDRRPGDLVQAALPSALEAVARSLRAGGSVRTALADAATTAPAPLADDLGRMLRASDRGIPLREVIDEWPQARPLPGVRLAAAALALGIDTGSGLARTLDGVAATLHERATIEREVRVLAAQARYSAGILIVAPVAFLVLVAAFDPSTVDFLVGTPVGLGCLAGGLVLDAAGGWWMARICREAR